MDFVFSYVTVSGAARRDGASSCKRTYAGGWDSQVFALLPEILFWVTAHQRADDPFN